MGKHARVKDILEAYSNKGMAAVARYLSDEDLIIEPETWVAKMKKLLDSHNWMSMEAEIASILFTFKLTPNDERRAAKELLNQGPADGGASTD